MLNQWTIVLPDGGQPMPCAHPFKICNTITRPSEAYSALTAPDTNMMPHEMSRPSGRKYFGLLRSDTDPIRNFEMP